MATIGLSKPYYAIYQSTDGAVSYSEGGLLAKAIEFSTEIDATEDNNLYADNAIAESDRSFSGGTLTITTDDLEQAASAAILGITPQKLSIDGLSTTGATEMLYDDDQSTPYLGFGIIIKKKVNNTYKYRAVVFTKIMFSIPADAASTQGETIEWQTPELTATIMRDDSTKHAWKREATLDSEADATVYIKNCLNIN
jgi:phi13 family phage major tail protein